MNELLDEPALPPELEKELVPVIKAVGTGSKVDVAALLAGAVGTALLGGHVAAGGLVALGTKLGLAKIVENSADAAVAKFAVELAEHQQAEVRLKQIRNVLHALHTGHAEEVRSALSVWFERNQHAAEEQFRQHTRDLRGYDGPLELERYYASARAQYRRTTLDAWHEAFPRVHHGTGARSHAAKLRLIKAVPCMAAVAPSAATDTGVRRPPFIATQGFHALDPRNGQKDFLKPEAFLPGRESEQEAQARAGATWLPIDRVELVRALCDWGDAPPLGATGISLRRPQRLFLVTGGGVGKSTNMRWLEVALNCAATGASTEAPLAVLIEADLLTTEHDFDGFVAQLARTVARLVSSATDQRWVLDALEHGLKQDLAAGRLIVLVDALDHVAPERVAPFALELQTARWDACRVVMAGRPQALKDWAEDSPRKYVVDLGRWRFIHPDEFDEDEAAAYLDKPGQPARYEQVKAALGGLAQVPRVLECARELSREDLAKCRTPSDIYWFAIESLIRRTIDESDPDTRVMGPKRARQVLAALAFQTLCPTVSEVRMDPTSRAELRDSPNGPIVELRARIASTGDAGEVDADLRRLAKFATIVGNGIVSATETEADAPSTLVWSNRTVQEFLAAHWLARYANSSDTARMRYHVFRPEEPKTDYYYELNVFLAEMPAVARAADRWVDAVSEWYRPYPNKTWPTEMMFRSWPTLHAIAGRALDDWWDCSYERLKSNDRVQPVKAEHDNSPAALAAAAAVLDDYQGRFQKILDGEHREVALELVGNAACEVWCEVPEGEYEMGSSEENQGFPAKTGAYWHAKLSSVLKGRKAADVAKECTPSYWFGGTAAGKRLQERDIAWLTRILEPLEAGARVTDEVYASAYNTIRDKWRRKDETPRENPQAIAKFDLQRYPVLHRWVRRWSPAHAQVVATCLDAIELNDANGRRIPIADPPDDHPAIYVSWYDAWAFCQWACWTDNSGKHYGLRLPHEVEWEYAARFAPAAGGQPARLVPRDQPYWWGNDFYKNPDGRPERIVDRQEAYADGTPGTTRAPGSPRSIPNGLGLHDMLGNVWEWMANIYDSSEDKTVRSRAEVHYSRAFPEGRAPVNPQRAIRGGLWYYLDLLATLPNRYRLTCEDRDYKIGFRVVREERPARNHG